MGQRTRRHTQAQECSSGVRVVQCFREKGVESVSGSPFLAYARLVLRCGLLGAVARPAQLRLEPLDRGPRRGLNEGQGRLSLLRPALGGGHSLERGRLGGDGPGRLARPGLRHLPRGGGGALQGLFPGRGLPQDRVSGQPDAAGGGASGNAGGGPAAADGRG